MDDADLSPNQAVVVDRWRDVTLAGHLEDGTVERIDFDELTGPDDPGIERVEIHAGGGPVLELEHADVADDRCPYPECYQPVLNETPVGELPDLPDIPNGHVVDGMFYEHPTRTMSENENAARR